MNGSSADKATILRFEGYLCSDTFIIDVFVAEADVGFYNTHDRYENIADISSFLISKIY